MCVCVQHTNSVCLNIIVYDMISLYYPTYSQHTDFAYILNGKHCTGVIVSTGKYVSYANTGMHFHFYSDNIKECWLTTLTFGILTCI